MEARFGRDLGSVRVHTDSLAARSAEAVHALAFTVGSHVLFGAGQYRPSTPAGRQLLGHELVHVLQQPANAWPGQSLIVGDEHDQAEHEARAFASAVAGAGGALRANSHAGTLHRQPKPTAATPARPGSPSCVPRTGLTEYGCYCGAGTSCTSGLSCTPSDALDACCRQHDADYAGCSFGDRYNPFGRCFGITWRADTNLCNCAHRLAGRLHGAAEAYRQGVMAIFCHAHQVAGAAAESMGEQQLECHRTCESVPLWMRGLCLQGCSPAPGMM
jgi:hypothetical protein